jgi:hypothetical protein
VVLIGLAGAAHPDLVCKLAHQRFGPVSRAGDRIGSWGGPLGTVDRPHRPPEVRACAELLEYARTALYRAPMVRVDTLLAAVASLVDAVRQGRHDVTVVEVLAGAALAAGKEARCRAAVPGGRRSSNPRRQFAARFPGDPFSGLEAPNSSETHRISSLHRSRARLPPEAPRKTLTYCAAFQCSPMVLSAALTACPTNDGGGIHPLTSGETTGSAGNSSGRAAWPR